MKVTLIQMNSCGNKLENEKKTFEMLEKSLKEEPDVICLSELFLSWGPDFEGGVVEIEEISKYQSFARDHHVNLILGTVSLKQEQSSKTTNTCFVIDREGSIVQRYDKIYMYKVNKNDFQFDEHDDTIPGNNLGIAILDGVKIGIGVCFDLRFPEYFRELVKEGAEVIFLPAHFTEKTGKIAWDILIGARAIENQVYFCACNQTGPSLCGKTKIVDYEGNTLQSLEKEEGFVTMDLDLLKLRDFRKEFPVLEQIKY